MSLKTKRSLPIPSFLPPSLYRSGSLALQKYGTLWDPKLTESAIFLPPWLNGTMKYKFIFLIHLSCGLRFLLVYTMNDLTTTYNTFPMRRTAFRGSLWQMPDVLGGRGWQGTRSGFLELEFRYQGWIGSILTKDVDQAVTSCFQCCYPQDFCVLSPPKISPPLFFLPGKLEQHISLQ